MTKNKTILVTGGAGYIGSQTVRELAEAGFTPIVYDNLSTGHREAVEGINGVNGIEVIEGDLNDIENINKTIKKYQPDAVFHFAASIEVEDSVKNPEKYFENNVVNGLNLLKVMRENDVDKLIFSSSAAVYGEAKDIPIKEDAIKNPLNPYGLTKLMFEDILASYNISYNLKSISLRYFNAAGADPSGEYGQDCIKPTHLITRVILTVLGKYPELEMFGDDYPTPDGTCVRDYIHIKDLAAAHVLALKTLDSDKFSPVYNLGTGHGYSVQDVVNMVKKITGVDFKVKISPRRAGDPAELIADSNLAGKELGFEPKYSDLETIIKTVWVWHKNHPDGYKTIVSKTKN